MFMKERLIWILKVFCHVLATAARVLHVVSIPLGAMGWFVIVEFPGHIL